MTAEERLQAHLLMMHGEPAMPLVGIQSLRQATRLRTEGLTYGDIARVMRIYHGDVRTENAWRSLLRKHGAPAKHHANGSARVAPARHGKGPRSKQGRPS